MIFENFQESHEGAGSLVEDVGSGGVEAVCVCVCVCVRVVVCVCR